MTEPLGSEASFTPVRRVHYFDGRLLTAADFEQDQQYHRDMRHLQNRAVGFGIVEGLEVHATPSGITVNPGYAFDALGREIVLATAVVLDTGDALLSAFPNPVVTATWAEVPDGVVPTTDATDTGAFTSWLEQPIITMQPAKTVTSPSLVLAGIRRSKRKGLVIVTTPRQVFTLRPGIST
jgi:hypothetical protein